MEAYVDGVSTRYVRVPITHTRTHGRRPARPAVACRSWSECQCECPLDREPFALTDRPVGGPAPGERSRAGGLVARSHCPVCGESGNPFLSLPYDTDPIAGYLTRFYNGALDATALTGQHYELVDCTSCGLVYQAHIPDDALLDHLYDHAALHDLEIANEARGLSVRRSWANDIEQCIKYFGGEPAAVEVLDFGSGPGLWLDMAAAYGCRTAGSEMSGVGLRRVIDAGHEAFTPDDLPVERFHFVNTEQVVEHLTDPRSTVDRLASALRPGGILRISVPNGTGIRTRLEGGDWNAPKGSPKSLNPVAPLEHLNCFDHGSLQRLGETVGLQPFRYPLRQFLDPMERIRFAASAVLHRFQRPTGTLQLFRKP
jgi:SAM-dependent methyltransferase